MKILVVDDEAPIRNICERILRGSGHLVSTAAAGGEAVERIREDWDVVITDVTMPGSVNGLEVLRRAKTAGSADVLMMTGYPELDVAIQALKLGAYDFILKPFSPETLEASVRRCADKRALSVELARERDLREELGRAYSELTRMRIVEKTFGLFVTPEVANYALSLPEDKSRGARRRVTVFFSDVRKFTSFAENASPEAAVDTLNSIFACVVSAIQKEGGIINKFMGDGILALFGAPLDLDGHEQAAARAALGAVAAVERLALSRRSQGRRPLHIGIAINTGEVVAGCLGTRTRTEYSVIGHAVNLAARLNALAEPGQILLGPETAKAMSGRLRCRELEPVSLAGVSEPVYPWELLA
ncbi:MAG TPA: adenylate/guanylate cyclase domain-containing protein [Elusimicrobiota bacterium]|jgi:class 3 adenylate cyclase|nr:adenylate/guanylate cyclase domain-containing protein [Elusimicrobiota bacterium]